MHPFCLNTVTILCTAVWLDDDNTRSLSIVYSYSCPLHSLLFLCFLTLSRHPSDSFLPKLFLCLFCVASEIHVKDHFHLNNVEHTHICAYVLEHANTKHIDFLSQCITGDGAQRQCLHLDRRLKENRGPKRSPKRGPSLLEPILSECVSLRRALKARPLAIHIMEVRPEVVWGLCHLSLRATRGVSSKKEVKETFYMPKGRNVSTNAALQPLVCLKACTRCV